MENEEERYPPAFYDDWRMKMVKDTKKAKPAQDDKVKLFTIAFNPKKQSITYCGDMLVEEAVLVIQMIARKQRDEQIRKEVSEELAKEAKGE